MAVMGVFRWPRTASIFSWSLLQTGLAGAQRILNILQQENDLDQNAGGYSAPIKGQVTFENVTFAYNKARVLDRISFNVEPGQTVAIVGQTGSGKSTLTQLINRTYDTMYGRVLVDGRDVREWDLTSLRSQISCSILDICERSEVRSHSRTSRPSTSTRP